MRIELQSERDSVSLIHENVMVDVTREICRVSFASSSGPRLIWVEMDFLVEHEAMLNVFQQGPKRTKPKGKPYRKSVQKLKQCFTIIVRNIKKKPHNWRYNFQIRMPVHLSTGIKFFVIPELDSILALHEAWALNEEHEFFIV